MSDRASHGAVPPHTAERQTGGAHSPSSPPRPVVIPASPPSRGLPPMQTPHLQLSAFGGQQHRLQSALYGSDGDDDDGSPAHSTASTLVLASTVNTPASFMSPGSPPLPQLGNGGKPRSAAQGASTQLRRAAALTQPLSAHPIAELTHAQEQHQQVSAAAITAAAAAAAAAAASSSASSSSSASAFAGGMLSPPRQTTGRARVGASPNGRGGDLARALQAANHAASASLVIRQQRPETIDAALGPAGAAVASMLRVRPPPEGAELRLLSKPRPYVQPGALSVANTFHTAESARLLVARGLAALEACDLHARHGVQNMRSLAMGCLAQARQHRAALGDLRAATNTMSAQLAEDAKAVLAVVADGQRRADERAAAETQRAQDNATRADNAEAAQQRVQAAAAAAASAHAAEAERLQGALAGARDEAAAAKKAAADAAAAAREKRARLLAGVRGLHEAVGAVRGDADALRSAVGGLREGVTGELARMGEQARAVLAHGAQLVDDARAAAFESQQRAQSVEASLATLQENFRDAEGAYERLLNERQSLEQAAIERDKMLVSAQSLVRTHEESITRMRKTIVANESKMAALRESFVKLSEAARKTGAKVPALSGEEPASSSSSFSSTPFVTPPADRGFAGPLATPMHSSARPAGHGGLFSPSVAPTPGGARALLAGLMSPAPTALLGAGAKRSYTSAFPPQKPMAGGPPPPPPLRRPMPGMAAGEGGNENHLNAQLRAPGPPLPLRTPAMGAPRPVGHAPAPGAGGGGSV